MSSIDHSRCPLSIGNTQPWATVVETGIMTLDHLKLDTYHRALDLLDLVGQIYDAMPPGRAHLKDQLDRAATSIVLNTAEGAGEFSPDEKVRFYRIARRSATETAAIFDILERRGAVPAAAIDPARQLLVRVVQLLVGLITKPRSGTGTGTGTGQAV
jgi:four helix bundle protein